MTASLTTHHRPWVPVVNMLVAVCALAIAVIALVTAPADVTAVIPATPGAVVADNPTANPAGPANHPVELTAIDGCDRIQAYYHPC